MPILTQPWPDYTPQVGDYVLIHANDSYDGTVQLVTEVVNHGTIYGFGRQPSNPDRFVRNGFLSYEYSPITCANRIRKAQAAGITLERSQRA